MASSTFFSVLPSVLHRLTTMANFPSLGNDTPDLCTITPCNLPTRYPVLALQWLFLLGITLRLSVYVHCSIQTAHYEITNLV